MGLKSFWAAKRRSRVKVFTFSIQRASPPPSSVFLLSIRFISRRSRPTPVSHPRRLCSVELTESRGSE